MTGQALAIDVHGMITDAVPPIEGMDTRATLSP